MKHLFSLIILLIITSCNENNKVKKNIARKDSIDFKNESLFKINFNKLSNNYKKEKQKLVQDFFNVHLNKNNDFNGSFLVAKNGQIIFEKYQGKSNFSTNQLITQNTPLHLASISKVLTAAAIFRLIDSKKINLEAEVLEILPQFPYPIITIKMLLNHRSGLPRYANFTDSEEIWGRKNVLHNNDILNVLEKNKFPLDFKPDTKFAYCNTNYAILALIIEKITKMSYKDAMQNLVFKPLKMKNTFVFDLEKDTNRVSQSYKSKNVKIPFDQLDAVYGDKNIYATPQDLLKFDMAMYSNNFISNQLKNEIYKGYSYEKRGIKNYGLGIRLREWETGQKIYYHNGWWHGNTTCYVTLRNDTVTLIALSNKYTRKVYQTMRASAIFGDYPFKLNSEENE